MTTVDCPECATEGMVLVGEADDKCDLYECRVCGKRIHVEQDT